jgi:integrase
MVLAGLRHCEVLRLRFDDVQVADRRLVTIEGRAAVTGWSRRRAASSMRLVTTCSMSGGRTVHRHSGKRGSLLLCNVISIVW